MEHVKLTSLSETLAKLAPRGRVVGFPAVCFIAAATFQWFPDLTGRFGTEIVHESDTHHSG
eukprot:scaffold1474_cov256-Pinguiococcus_pyrenoidosus.AAC.8